MKMVESSPNGYKTQLEKGKLLVMSNFSFSHSVFERLALQTHNNQGPFGKGLTPYKTPEPSAIQNLTMGSLILTGFVTHRYLGYSYIIKSLPHNPHNPDFNDPDIERF